MKLQYSKPSLRFWVMPLSLAVALTLQAAPAIAANRGVSSAPSLPNQGAGALATGAPEAEPAGQVSQEAAELARSALFSLVLAGSAAFLGYHLGRRVKQPIHALAAIAQNLQTHPAEPADLQRLDALANRGDDVGQLAQVLQEMAQGTSEREQALSSQIAHLQAQMRAGNPQATGLEMAYYEALRKKSAWLRQQISQR